MLSIRENFLETIHNGHPDRFVKQFEYMERVYDPVKEDSSSGCERGGSHVNAWGVHIFWPEEQPGPYPLHDDEHIVLKDITKWREVIHFPDPSSYSEDDWAPVMKQVAAIDREQKFVTTGMGPGILERIIMLMGMTEGLASFLLEPEATFEFVDFLADWEIACAKEIFRHFQPDMLFQHDDWGRQTSLFMSPETFEQIMLPAYKKVYGFYKDNGVDIIVHHSDSYAVEYVPYMIEMGVDVFQGAVSENNIPALVEKYGDKICFHAGLDNGKFDVANWSAEAMEAELDRVIRECGGKHIIPGLTMGGPGSLYPGVYEAVDEIIDRLSKKYFK